MSTRKASAATALTGANVAVADKLWILDPSDTTDAATGTTKAILAFELAHELAMQSAGTAVRHVSASFTGMSAPYYTTITLALAAATSGDLIIVYPGTYEAVTVSAEGVKLIGVNREAVHLTSLTITAYDVVISGLTVDGDLTCTSQETGVDGTWTWLRDINFAGNINVGTSGTPIKSRVYFWSCYFDAATTKTFYVKNFSFPSVGHQLKNCYIFRAMNFNLDGNGFLTTQNTGLHFASLTMTGTPDSFTDYNYIEAMFGDFVIDSGMTITGRNVIDIIGGNFFLNGSITIADELIFQAVGCLLTGSDGSGLVFNSTENCALANIKCYSKVTGITGTGLGNLHVQHCIFPFASPGGLAEDLNNSWSAYGHGL